MKNKTPTASQTRKGVPFNIRIEGDLLTDWADLADSYGTNSSALLRMVMENLIRDRKKHGKRLIYPPEFNHFTADSKTASD